MRTFIAIVGFIFMMPWGLAELVPGQAPAADWHQWRGPNRDGHSAEAGLLKEWPASGPRQLWRASGAGTGFSSFSSSNGRLYTLGLTRQRRVRDGVRCCVGEALVGSAKRAALPQRDGRRPAQHADRGGRPRLRIWRHRRAVVSRGRHRPEALVGERRPAVRREHALLGLQRVAADRRRPHHPQRRRPPRVDCRHQQAGWQDAVAEP